MTINNVSSSGREHPRFLADERMTNFNKQYCSLLIDWEAVFARQGEEESWRLTCSGFARN